MTEITYTTLASINVNDHTEKKGTLTYLSWAWAVDQLLRHDPDASWDYRCWNDQPVCLLHDGTAMVCCTVTVGERSKTAWLPVMDNKNRAIVGPDAFAINSAMQRALVKDVAYLGTADGGTVRLTFDRNVRGVVATEWAIEQVGEGAPLLDRVVCEFKFRVAMPALFKGIVVDLGLTPTPVSKYRTFVRAAGLVPAIAEQASGVANG